MMNVLTEPKVWATLLAVFLILMAYARVRKVSFDTRTLSFVGLMLALAFILHNIFLYRFPQGGAVTLGGMLPIILVALLYGAEVGFLTGFVFGMINLMQNPFILHPLQVLFDYPLPYMALGLAGYFKKNAFLGATVGIVGRFLCHYISGIIFFASYAPVGVSPYWYSFYFNLSYLGLDYIICIILLRFVPIKYLDGIVVKKIRSVNTMINK